jgi:hypothetical protein
MRASRWCSRALVVAVVAAAAATSGCKGLTERYIALEVWKYERCFGHLPPGFVPPGAQPPAAAPGRVCGQGAAGQPACQGAPMGPMGCSECGGGMDRMIEGQVSSGPSLPTPAGVTAGKPVVISDELVVP